MERATKTILTVFLTLMLAVFVVLALPALQANKAYADNMSGDDASKTFVNKTTGDVVYCFNRWMSFPGASNTTGDPYKVAATLRVGDDFYQYIGRLDQMNPMIYSVTPRDDFNKFVPAVLYFGYPTNGDDFLTALKTTNEYKNISADQWELAVQQATQYALWYYTDNVSLGSTLPDSIAQKLIAKAEADFANVPSSYEFEMWEPDTTLAGGTRADQNVIAVKGAGDTPTPQSPAISSTLSANGTPAADGASASATITKGDSVTLSDSVVLTHLDSRKSYTVMWRLFDTSAPDASIKGGEVVVSGIDASGKATVTIPIGEMSPQATVTYSVVLELYETGGEGPVATHNTGNGVIPMETATITVTEPGGDTPGGDEPGGDTPGGDEPGGDTPGGDTPGGDTPSTPDTPKDTPKDTSSNNKVLPKTADATPAATLCGTAVIAAAICAIALRRMRRES